MKRQNISENNQSGFIALITAIIFTVILLIIAVTLNQSGFFSRSALSDSEYKEISIGLAEACADQALLKLANNPSYGGPDLNIPVGSEKCDILAFDSSLDPITIKTKGVFQEATTNFEIKVQKGTLVVQSWEEKP